MCERILFRYSFRLRAFAGSRRSQKDKLHIEFYLLQRKICIGIPYKGSPYAFSLLLTEEALIIPHEQQRVELISDFKRNADHDQDAGRTE